jgi:HEAT repeat protein
VGGVQYAARPMHQDVPPTAPEAAPDLSAPPGAEPEPVPSPLRQFLGLFVVPLVVVLLCVGVFIGFGYIAMDRQTTGDLIDDLQASWKPRRVQAAYELSKVLLADPKALEQDPGARDAIRRLFQETDDPELRRYLALVLGRTRDPAAVPLLAAALEDPDDHTRIYALWALGTLGDPRARQPLVAALADRDPGIRKTAAFALGELGDRSAVPGLVPLLDDGIADVRWNAALALARLGSDAGVPVLESMADRRLLAKVPGITPEQQEEAMTSALRALAAVGGEQERALFERLAREDPSLKVRQAAIQATRTLDRR